ncbi:hypothetical protein ACQFX9_29000 [Aliinostoc sp. HNIBRCY26]|uniref:hypothetical protein n=1 Tax=Aliinostoc sp. HNIBRCY26 TaxID=3418997 RepID=UPI003CFCC4C8
MAAVRKSAVSTTGSWFRQGSTPRRRRRKSTSLGSSAITEPSPVITKTQRPTSKGLSLPLNPRRESPLSPASSTLKSPPHPKLRNTKSESLDLPVVPNAQVMPLWLLRLNALHRHSSIIAFLLVSSVLAVYGWTVYAQELWGQNYRRLQNLQRYERQMTTTNATLKNKMAEEAEKSSTGLVSPSPANSVFLSTTSPPTPLKSPDKKPTSETKQPTSSPMAY